MRKVLLSIFALLSFALPQMASAQIVPGYTKAIQTFGDYTNANPAPTTGTLTGFYNTRGPWVQTGPITCIGCRMKFGSTVTINNTFAGTAGVEGNGPNRLYSAAFVKGGVIQGQMTAPAFGPGGGGGFFLDGTTEGNASGGGHGGAGGAGGSISPYSQVAGKTYPLDLYLPGCAGGDNGNGVAGSGGAGIYIEAIGNVLLTSGANMTANGGASGGSGTGAGSGGGIDIRSLGNITVNAGGQIHADGGAGGSYSGGGGGIVNLMPGPGMSAVNSGTVTAAAGSGTPAGSIGVVTVGAPFTGPRMNY